MSDIIGGADGFAGRHGPFPQVHEHDWVLTLPWKWGAGHWIGTPPQCPGHWLVQTEPDKCLMYTRESVALWGRFQSCLICCILIFIFLPSQSYITFGAFSHISKMRKKTTSVWVGRSHAVRRSAVNSLRSPTCPAHRLRHSFSLVKSSYGNNLFQAWS